MKTFLTTTLFLTTSTIFAAGAFHGDPPDANHPWAVHDINRPLPPIVTPGAKAGGAPSDATVLFGGTKESFKANWVHEKPADKRKGDWKIANGVMQVTPGAGGVRTSQSFGDCQLHVEWKAPAGNHHKGQKKSNSGVFLPGGIEVQVLDIYENSSYPDGMAGAVYGVMPPAANALRPSGEWQSYDIIFRRPVAKDGKVIDEGSMTVLINGIVVQDNTPLDGGGGHKRRSNPDRPRADRGPIRLQDHGNPVSFRNIWIRPLRPRPSDGGTDGRISEAASTAKRAEIAADIRNDAAGLQGLDQTMRLLESLCYAADDETWTTVDQALTRFAGSLNAQNIDAKKWEIIRVLHALIYCEKHQIIARGNEQKAALEQIAVERDWKVEGLKKKKK